MTLLAITASSALASAGERASVALAYARRDAAATACPDEATFRSLVSAKLGYDPFVANGALALAVELEPRGKEIVGRLSLTGAGNERRGERTLRSGGDDCLELVTSMALAAAVAVDPDAVRAQASPPSSPPPAVTQPPPPAPPPPLEAQVPDRPVPPAPKKSSTALRIQVGGVLPIGIVPAVRGGLRAGAALDVGAWSIGAEGAFLFSSSRTSAAGEVSAYVVHGSLVPCVRPVAAESLLFDLCVVGSLGAMRSTAEGVMRARPLTDLFATVGPRLSFTAMASSAIGLAATADLPVPLSRTHLLIDDGGRREEVWAPSAVGFVGGLSLVFRLR